MSAANIAPQGAPHKTRHQSDKAWSTTVSLAGVAIAALALLGCYLFWGHEKLLFPLRERESAALDVDGVPELLANAGIAEVRRLPDSRMYVVMKDGTRSRGACLSDGHPVPGPFSSCVSRSMQPWRQLPDEFDYRLVASTVFQYRGDAVPSDMDKAAFAQAIREELRTAQVLAREVSEGEHEKARVKATWGQ